MVCSDVSVPWNKFNLLTYLDIVVIQSTFVSESVDSVWQNVFRKLRATLCTIQGRQDVDALRSIIFNNFI